MTRSSRRLIGAILLGALPLATLAQSRLNLDNPLENAEKVANIGGTAAMDIITLKAAGPGAPLRYANVIPNSEQVQLDGRPLQRARDYSMDYDTGVVYLKVAQRAGQTMTVTYRYDAKADPKKATALSGIQTFRYQVAPEKLGLIMGLGVAERAADGSVMQSNVFGFNNSFKFAGGGLSGVYIHSEREKTSNTSGLNFNPNFRPGDASTEEGSSQLIVQNLQTKVLGGSFNVDYQDVGKNFASFGSAKSAGVDDATIQRLQNEKGLTRFGLGFNDMKVGNAALSSNYRTVGDGNSGISWRSLGMKQGGLNVNWSSQKVDSNFTRFKDIAEKDREQLLREKGMSREAVTGELAQKFGKLSFSQNTIRDDASGKEIKRSEFGLDTTNVKFNLGEQEVSQGFTRFQSLLGNEQAMYGREAGLKRQWVGLEASITKGAPALKFNQSILRGNDSEFVARDTLIGAKTWSLQHTERKVDQKFGSLRAMADGEVDQHIKTIAQMYGPNVATRPEDRNGFFRSNGIERTYTKFGAQPFKNWNVSFSQLTLKGQQESGTVTTADLQTKSVTLNYRKQDLGAKFSELANLMDFERQRLGTVAGLERSDLGLSMNLGGKKKLDASNMSASVANAGAKRTSLSYTDTKIDVKANFREVSSNFGVANQLVDAEKDLLASLRGYKQQDARVQWKLLPGLNIDALLFDAANDQTDEFRRMRHLLLDWTPDGTTKVNYASYEQKSSDPLSTLFASKVERLSFQKDLGRLGKFRYLDERQAFDGRTATQADMRKQFLTYEAKLDAKTSLRTEQTRTHWDNGEKENISANTISTELSKRVGVAVTDVKVDRKGDQNDEAKRNYGFWLDLGNNLRFSYGYARHLQGEDAGTLTTSVTLGQNTGAIAPDKIGGIQGGLLGNLNIAGGYGANQWDRDDRTQAFSNIKLSTAKPFRFGPLSEMKFQFGMDTASDRTRWLREDRAFGFSGKLDKNAFSFDYRGQMHQSGIRAIDRSYRITTDPTETNWLRANVMYKMRTLPDSKSVMIRDLSFAARATKTLTVSHHMLTNPELPKSDALLGSIPQAARSNKWKIDHTQSQNMTFGLVWEELINEQNKNLSRVGGVTMKLFERSGSPLNLYYGIEQSDRPGLRQTAHRYSIQYDQKPGTNQTLSFFLGNLSYEHNVPNSFTRNNWTLRMDYQLRF